MESRKYHSSIRAFLGDHAAYAWQLAKGLLGRASVGPIGITIRQGALIIRGARIRNARVPEQIGIGANGVVFRVFNDSLRREEALKVWIALRTDDDRDKAVQAIEEARKQTAAASKSVVAVYGVERVRGYVLARMQYVPGKNLNEHLKEYPDMRADMLLRYMQLMQETTHPGIYHGDPHAGNVLVYWDESDKFDKHWELVLCDFGTSYFSEAPLAGKTRHWAKIRETTEKLLRPLPQFQFCWAAFERGECSVANILASSPSPELMPHLSLTQIEQLEIKLRFGPYQDLANDLAALL